MSETKRNFRSLFSEVINFSNERVKEGASARFSEIGEVEGYKNARKRALTLLDKFIKRKKSRILDVGCASGAISIELAKKGHIVKGIDFSAPMISASIKNKEFQKISNISFEHLDVLRLKDNQKYDYVLSLFNLLTYFSSDDDRRKAIDNMIKSLKKGGILIIDTTNKFGSLRLILKELLFKTIFLLSLRNRPFGDVYSSPMFSESNKVLFQHYFSKKEITKFLEESENISYEIRDYSLFLDSVSKREMLIIVKKIN